MNVKIFGREPAAIVGAIQAVLALLLSFGALSGIGLSTQADLAVVMGVVGAASALYLAYVTSETLLAPLVELTKAALAMGAIYGLTITVEQTGLLIATITALIAAWQRSNVSPLVNPTFSYIAPDDVVTPGEGGYFDSGLLFRVVAVILLVLIVVFIIMQLASSPAEAAVLLRKRDSGWDVP